MQLCSDFEGRQWVSIQTKNFNELAKMYIYHQQTENLEFVNSVLTNLKHQVSRGCIRCDQLATQILTDLRNYFGFKITYTSDMGTRTLSIQGFVRLIFAAYPNSGQEKYHQIVKTLLTENFGDDRRFVIVKADESFLMSVGREPYVVNIAIPDNIPKIPFAFAKKPDKNIRTKKAQKEQEVVVKEKVVSAPIVEEPKKITKSVPLVENPTQKEAIATVEPVKPKQIPIPALVKKIPAPPVLIKTEGGQEKKSSTTSFFIPQTDVNVSGIIPNFVSNPDQQQTAPKPKQFVLKLEKEDAMDIQKGPEPKSMENEVEEWLSDLRLSRFYSNFKQNGVQSFEDIRMMRFDNEVLLNMGITQQFYRQLLLEEIETISAAITTVPKWLKHHNLGYLAEKFKEIGVDDVDLLIRLGKSRVFALATKYGL